MKIREPGRETSRRRVRVQSIGGNRSGMENSSRIVYRSPIVPPKKAEIPGGPEACFRRLIYIADTFRERFADSLPID